MHSLVAILGAIIAAAGSGVLLARCFLAPRGDLVAWSVGLLGLLVSLGAQAMGYLSGFDASTFRAMEVGGQVIAPLAFALALSEVAAKSTVVRFFARLYVPSLGMVALVVLTLDQLTKTSFSKTWPPPAVFYQAPPNYVLTFGIGPATALVAILAVVTVLARSGLPGWNAVLPGQLLGGAAALGLAYPGLAQLVIQHLHIHLPLGSVFSLGCALAAGLAWLAALRTSRVSLAALRGHAAADEDRDRIALRGQADRYQDQPGGAADYLAGHGTSNGLRGAGSDRWADAPGADGYGPGAGYGDPRYFDSPGDRGVYRGGGLYRPERPGHGPGRGRSGDDWHDDDLARDGYADFATGDFIPGDLEAADLERAGRDHGGGWQSRPGPGGRLAGYNADSRGRGHRAARHEDDLSDRRRAELFGQITIYTLVEDRVGDFDQLTGRVVEQIRNLEPDTLVFIAHAVPSAPAQRILYQVYRSRAAYQKHLSQPHIQQFDLDRRPYVLATNVVELGLQQAKVSPLPFPSVAELFPEPGYDTSGFERPDYLRDYGRTSSQRGGGAREFG